MTPASSSRRTAPTRGRARRRRPVRRRGGRSAAALRRRQAELRLRWSIGFAVAGVLAMLIGVGALAVAMSSGSMSFGGEERCVAPTSQYSAEQVAHAETILAAGRDAGLPQRDQTIAVMTAMGESSLRNIDYGDWETDGVTNPDGSRTTSVGLFQQQDNWGTREERLDPYTAASLFYRALVARVPERDEVTPTIVAHRVQVNRDPLHYEPYWERAEALVGELVDPGSGCR